MPIAVLAIALVAVATRIVTFGNPLVELDSQFYVLVGDAVAHGKWPYIDVWDRKPVGLFLLFAAISRVFGASILAMQLVATAFAAATAIVIRHLALRLTGPRGALLAGLAYLLMLPLFGGQSGQSPVFYNLFMILAFALLVSSIDRPRLDQHCRAALAILLCGLTLTIKPVSLPEGAFIGLALLWLFRRSGASMAHVVIAAALLAALALLPSLIALAVYAAHGPAALDAYSYANFVSIFQKRSLGPTARLAGLTYFLIYITPLLLFASMGALALRRDPTRRTMLTLVVAWLGAAAVGYVLVPNFFEHYALPLLAPLSLLAAPLFGRRDGGLFFVALSAFCLIQGAILDLPGNRRDRADMALLGRAIEQARHGGCLFVAEGPAWLYRQSPACRVTRFQFPAHLLLFVEADALGVNQQAELARALARRPAVIVTDAAEIDQHPRATNALLYGVLTRDYRRLDIRADRYGKSATLRLWQRKALASSPY